MEAKLLLDYEPAPGGTIVRALVTVTGEAPTAKKRAPIAVSLVLDRSGSMGGEPLEAAKEAAVTLVRHLHADDEVSAVAYDHDVQTVATPTRGEGFAEVIRAIRSIDEGGSTNLSGGWLRGREMVAAARRKELTRRVILLTDGHANAGITESSLLAGLTRGARHEGVSTSTIGFGAGYDEDLLRAMADGGGGNAWYIERADQATGVFGEEIAGLLALSAQNLAVEVQPGAQVTLTMVHHDYPWHPTPGGRRFEIGDLYAHEPRKLLVEFLVGGEPSADPRAIATLVVHAHVLLADGNIEKRTISIPVAETLDAAGKMEPTVRTELLRLAAAKAREEAARMEQEGRAAEAASHLRHMASEIAASPVPPTEELLASAADLGTLAERMEGGEWDAADRKYATQRAYNARRGKASYDVLLARPPEPKTPRKPRGR